MPRPPEAPQARRPPRPPPLTLARRRRILLLFTLGLGLAVLLTFFAVLRAGNVNVPSSSLAVAAKDPMQKSCELFGSPSSRGPQKCCKVSADGASSTLRSQWVCLPNLVILGAAKAGTTALFSLLQLHPSTITGRVKELTLYCDERRYDDLISGRFHKLNLALQSRRSLIEKTITIDATPNYLTEINGCQRAAHHLPQSARFIVLIRHPVERIFSQLKMRFRYDMIRQSFSFWVYSNFDAIKQCLLYRPQALAKCLDMDKYGFIGSLQRNFVRAVLSNKKLCFSSELNFRETCLKEKGPLSIAVHPRDPWLIFNATTTRMINFLRRKFRPHRCIYSSCRPLFNATWQEDCIGECGCQCFNHVESASAFQSAYLPQLLHCFQFIEQSRVLVIDHSDLQRNMPGTMHKVIEFAGLEPITYSADMLAQAEHEFDRNFPSFKVDIGWSGSEADLAALRLPDELREGLNRVFHADTEGLRQLTGLPLAGWP